MDYVEARQFLDRNCNCGFRATTAAMAFVIGCGVEWIPARVLVPTSTLTRIPELLLFGFSIDQWSLLRQLW